MKLRIVAVAGLLFVAVASAARAQSLGDLARKAAVEREAKSKTEKAPPAVTVTNKDLTSASTAGGVSPAKPSGGQRAGVKTPPAPAPAPAGAKDEAYWRARMLPLRNKLLSDRDAAAVANKRLAELRYNLTPNVASREASEAERARLTTEVQSWNAILDADLRAMKDLREEARRAGAPSVWLR
jgi:hypothetical protein